MKEFTKECYLDNQFIKNEMIIELLLIEWLFGSKAKSLPNKSPCE